MRRLAALACLAFACGDNGVAAGPALAASTHLTVVAHADDDLLHMQPDVLEAVQAGDTLTAIYVGVPRHEGALAAYSEVIGAASWHCGTLSIADLPAHHCLAASVSLVFLDVQDLAALWRTDAARRDSLVRMLAQVLRETAPRIIRTHDASGSHGRDDEDHLAVGALTVLALAQSNRRAEMLAYRGDAAAEEPPNKLTPIFDASLAMLSDFDGTMNIDESRVDLLLRRYALGMRPRVGGRLRSNNQCISDGLQLVSCPAAPVWRLDSAGELRALDLCLTAGDDGTLSMTTCTGGPSRRFFVDDDGIIFSGAPPVLDSAASSGFLWCLAPSGDSVRLERCHAASSARWELVPDTVSTLRTDIGITATGREVRLGDVTGDGKADLCTIAGGLVCAAGTGTGSFLPATSIAALPIEPKSLVLGDVDGDGRGDACGRDASGILCSTAANQFAAERWTPAFQDALAMPTTAASLAAVDVDADGTADICGTDTTGVVCATHGTDSATVLTTWPEPDATVFIADLDGDRRADWCSATDTGPACGVFSHRALTSDGSAWGYSLAGTVEVFPATTATVAVGDIDGDGRADLCTPRDDRISCARSQGRAFGPRATLAILPNQSVASALWLGDLDGDGRADPCVDTGATIVCAVQP